MNPTEIWENGVSLRVAFREFGNRDLLNEYDATHSSEIHFVAPEIYGEHPDLQPDKSNQQELISEIHRHKTDACSEIEYHLCRDFKAGRLLGVGYSLPRQPTDKPAFIPKDVWECEVDFQQNLVNGNGLEFVEVRVYKTGDGGNSRRQQGRPSREAQIIQAFENLLNEGALDVSKSRAQYFDLIRAKVAALYPHEAENTKGLNDKTLYRVLGPLWLATEKHL